MSLQISSLTWCHSHNLIYDVCIPPNFRHEAGIYGSHKKTVNLAISHYAAGGSIATIEKSKCLVLSTGKVDDYYLVLMMDSSWLLS